MAEVMGLIAEVLKYKGGSCSNGGLSSEADEVTIVGIVQAGRQGVVEPVYREARVFAPNAERPPVAIVHRLGLPSYFAPVDVAEDGALTLKRDGVGPMAGGCYVATSDSRFRELTGGFGAVSLHDRFETAAQYASHD